MRNHRDSRQSVQITGYASVRNTQKQPPLLKAVIIKGMRGKQVCHQIGFRSTPAWADQFKPQPPNSGPHHPVCSHITQTMTPLSSLVQPSKIAAPALPFPNQEARLPEQRCHTYKRAVASPYYTLISVRVAITYKLYFIYLFILSLVYWLVFACCIVFCLFV